MRGTVRPEDSSDGEVEITRELVRRKPRRSSRPVLRRRHRGIELQPIARVHRAARLAVQDAFRERAEYLRPLAGGTNASPRVSRRRPGEPPRAGTPRGRKVTTGWSRAARPRRCGTASPSRQGGEHEWPSISANGSPCTASAAERDVREPRSLGPVREPPLGSERPCPATTARLCSSHGATTTTEPLRIVNSGTGDPRRRSGRSPRRAGGTDRLVEHRSCVRKPRDVLDRRLAAERVDLLVQLRLGVPGSARAAATSM